jgi:5'-nucleotidase (lipoprotein e(P4) family)
MHTAHGTRHTDGGGTIRRMSRRRRSLSWVFIVAAAGCGPRVPPAVAPAAPGAATITVRDTHEDLHAVLWMQTAAEYRALTTAIYARAAVVLDAALQDPSWTAALEQTGAFQSLPPAVVLDLDETVLDNSAFQGQLVRERQTYTEDAWRAWVHMRAAGAVPGAQAFIHAAEGRGVRVLYVSNRAAADEGDTILNLQALGISANGDTLLSSGERGWTSDKAARRASVCREYRVLLLVGDDLGDFVAVARLGPADRAALVDRYAERWLERWMLLPNPSYGSWSRALTPGVTDDRDVLDKKLAMIRGYR